VTEDIDRWRALLEQVVEREFGHDVAVAARSQVDLTANALARVAALWPEEWAAMLPEDEA
jgi:hypothetical protein